MSQRMVRKCVVLCWFATACEGEVRLKRTTETEAEWDFNGEETAPTKPGDQGPPKDNGSDRGADEEDSGLIHDSDGSGGKGSGGGADGGADGGGPEPRDCRPLTLEWYAPVEAARLTLSQELTEDGVVVLPWYTVATTDAHTITTTVSDVCAGHDLRMSGGADTDGDGAEDLWTCHRLDPDHHYVAMGETRITWGEDPIPTELIENGLGNGCDIGASL